MSLPNVGDRGRTTRRMPFSLATRAYECGRPNEWFAFCPVRPTFPRSLQRFRVTESWPVSGSYWCHHGYTYTSATKRARYETPQNLDSDQNHSDLG